MVEKKEITGKILNISSNRYVNSDGKIGKNIIKNCNVEQTDSNKNNVYYNNQKTESLTANLRFFHNYFVKKQLITNLTVPGNTLIDYACGKGGDLNKWIDGKYSFILGIDIFKDNIENKNDGAKVRYVGYIKKFKKFPKVVFLHGDSSLNIRNGKIFDDKKSLLISDAIFGNLDSAYNLNYQDRHSVNGLIGRATNGFDISSCQFAIHYFFKNLKTISGFLQNVADCTKLGGYFIGTTYDGKTIFNKLKNIEKNGNLTICVENKKIWSVQKKYNYTEFSSDESSLGYTINVYQETINTYNEEYLVNFRFLVKLMKVYGFELLSKKEALSRGFPSGSGMFKELYEINEGRNNLRMNEYEKSISFLNRFFIFKKVKNL